MEMTHYRNYQINHVFDIFKDGRPAFGGPGIWYLSLDEAKARIDRGYVDAEAARRAFAKLPSLGVVTGHCELESGSEQRDRDEDKINQYYELQNEPDL